jgi:hypothetical protein
VRQVGHLPEIQAFVAPYTGRDISDTKFVQRKVTSDATYSIKRRIIAINEFRLKA